MPQGQFKLADIEQPVKATGQFRISDIQAAAPEPEKPGFFGRAYEASAKPIVDAVKAADTGGYGPYGKAVNAASDIAVNMGKAIAERGAPAVAYDAFGDVFNRITGDASEGNYGGTAGTVVGTLLPFKGGSAVRGAQAVGRGAVDAASQTARKIAASPGVAQVGKGVAKGAGGAILTAAGHPFFGGGLAAEGVKDVVNFLKQKLEARKAGPPAPTPPVPAGTFTSPLPTGPMPAPAPVTIPSNPAMLLNPPVAAPVPNVRRTPVWQRESPSPQAVAQPAVESSTVDAELQRVASIREARRRAAVQQQAAPPQQPAAAPTPAVAQPAAPVAQSPSLAAPAAEASMDDALDASVQLAKLRQPGESIADVARRLTQKRAATVAPPADDLMGQMSATIDRVKRGEKATPPEMVQGMEQASATASGDVAENASRVNRTARGNTAARQFSQPELDALAEQLPLLVDQADSPIWQTIADATQTTVPTTRAGRLEIVKGIQRQQGMAKLTAPPAEAMSIDEAMQQMAVAPAPKRTGKKTK